MSNLPGNPHVEDAMNYSCEASEIQAHENAERFLYVQQASAHATLALAYEQRTANLIAYAEQMRRDRTSGTNAATTEVLMAVEARLGLGENNA